MSEVLGYIPPEVEKTPPNETELPWSGMKFHHARDLRHVKFDVVQQYPPMGGMDYKTAARLENDAIYGKNKYDEDGLLFERSYRWLQEQVGFYPLFLAYGEDLNSLMMTGYYKNFARKYVQQNQNSVLFSYKDIDNPVFTDFYAWHIVLNHGENRASQEELDEILRPGWTREQWDERERTDPGSVQAVVPRLDLRKADLVLCRNKKTKKRLEDMGFDNVQTFRVPVPSW